MTLRIFLLTSLGAQFLLWRYYVGNFMNSHYDLQGYTVLTPPATSGIFIYCTVCFFYFHFHFSILCAYINISAWCLTTNVSFKLYISVMLSIPYRMKIYAGFNIATWFRCVKFTGVNSSQF